MSLLAVVIADTHLPRRARALPEKLLAHLGRADLILHAGDLMVGDLLKGLGAYAPVLAVRGNLDPPDLDLPETLEFDFGGARVAMIHDSGRKQGRRARLRRRFPDARVVVFGHSHIPLLEDEDGLMLLNPGSPTDKRRQPHYTFALLHAEEGRVRAEIVAL
jgi:putative phosphoesterase